MIEINHYTGNWQEAIRPECPEVGTKVKMPDWPDAREANDFKTLLKKNNRRLEWIDCETEYDDNLESEIEVSVYEIKAVRNCELEV